MITFARLRDTLYVTSILGVKLSNDLLNGVVIWGGLSNE